MCGIAGFFNYKTGFPADERRLAAILESMRYRGPDHLGCYADGDIAIGNVRLAIQGLSSAGNQPVYNENKTVVVVYNGEIYNFPELKIRLQNKGHVFGSDTDTEVLVHLYEEYGADFAGELNGMFAFALFDIRTRQLLLGRDPAAQKPLYIERNKHGIFFSSELKSMLPCLERRSLDPDAVRTFLSMGYVLEPQTLLREVEALEPGIVLSFNYGGESSKRFWQIRCTAADSIETQEDWIARADETLRGAVRRHLLSDVPVTLLLSGGVDSSLLALYLADEHKITKAFTGSFVDSASHDEYSYAHELARHCGFELERVRLSNRMLADNLEPFLQNASMPLGDNSAIAAYCMAKQISREFKVVLGGDGGDELFGGYPTYLFPYLKQTFATVPRAAISGLHRLAAVVSDKQRYLSWGFKLQQLLLACDQKDILAAHFSLKNFLPDHIADSILSRSFFCEASISSAESIARFRQFDAADACDSIKRLCAIDFCTFLRSATIPKVERNCMLSSLEARMPLLDKNVLELSRQTAPALMVSTFSTKKCLKALLQKKMSGSIRLNPIKQGFTPPVHALLQKELRAWKEHWLEFKSPFFMNGLSSKLSPWRCSGWDLHRLDWNICVLNDWCFRNKLL